MRVIMLPMPRPRCSFPNEHARAMQHQNTPYDVLRTTHYDGQQPAHNWSFADAAKVLNQLPLPRPWTFTKHSAARRGGGREDRAHRQKNFNSCRLPLPQTPPTCIATPQKSSHSASYICSRSPFIRNAHYSDPSQVARLTRKKSKRKKTGTCVPLTFRIYEPGGTHAHRQASQALLKQTFPPRRRHHDVCPTQVMSPTHSPSPSLPLSASSSLSTNPNLPFLVPRQVR